MTDKPKWTDLFGIDPDYTKDATEEPKYTESDMRVLTEAALRLGRKEAGEEIAATVERWFPDPHAEDENCEDCYMVHQIAKVARNIGSQPAPHASSVRTDLSVDTDLPQDPQAVREPQGGSDG